MRIEDSSRLRVLRLMLIIATLVTVGFSVIGLLIKSWLFALMGICLGLIFGGSGLGLNYMFKKEHGAILIMKYLKPILLIVIGLQVLIAIAKLSNKAF